MMASTPRHRPKENVDPQQEEQGAPPTMKDRDKFMAEVGRCQSILETMVVNDEILSLDCTKMEAALWDDYYLMKQKELSTQEYYQGCTTVLLAKLFEHAGKPSSVITSLQNCLSSANPSATSTTDDNQNASLFSLTMDQSQSHPGMKLETWPHILGLVSTIRSNVYVVRKIRRKTTKNNRHLIANSNSHNNNNNISDDKLDAMWVIPLSYIVGYVVYDACCAQQQLEGKTLFCSWNGDIRKKIFDILFAAFPLLRPTDNVDAGLMLLQLDLLQNDPNNMSEVISTKSVSADLCEDNVLKPMVAATDLQLYPLLARCSQVFLSRLDKDSTEDIIQACSKLLKKQNPIAYLRQLDDSKASVPKTNALALAPKGGTNANALVPEETSNPDVPRSHRDQLLSPAYPLLAQIEALLVDDNVDRAINIVVKMEACSILSDDEKIEGWGRIFHYLFQTGQIFLDGKANRQEYLATRKIILEKIVTSAGPIGLGVFLDSYENLLEQVALLPHVSNEEHTFIRRACHQTVLRILQAKHNETRGMDQFQKTYWKNVEESGVPTGTSSLTWSSLSLSLSREEQLSWACRLLTEENPIPETLKFSDSPYPDLVSFMSRGQPKTTDVALENKEGTLAAKSPSPQKAAVSPMEVEEEPLQQQQLDKEDHDDEKHEVQHEAKTTHSEENEVIMLDDSDDDDFGDPNEIVPRGESADEDDETADEESVNELLAGSEEKEEESEDDDDEKHADSDEHSEADQDDDDDNNADVEEEETNRKSVEPEVVDMLDDDDEEEHDDDDDDDDDDHEAGDNDSHSAAEVHENEEEVAASQSMDEAGSQMGYEGGSQTGYEPEDTHGFTEEEVSEAMHTEDEEEERLEVKMARQPLMQNEPLAEPINETVKPLASTESHTLSDMDDADEHTATEQEEDLGAESSELDEGEATDVAPIYPSAQPESLDTAGEATTLMDYAKMAQQQAAPSTSRTLPADAVQGPSSPWHYTSQQEPTDESGPSEEPQNRDESVVYSAAEDTNADTNAAHAGNSTVGFLEEASYTVASEEEINVEESPSKVVLDNLQEALKEDPPEAAPTEETGKPRASDTVQDKSVMGMSYADTSAAYAGSVSYVNSPNYEPDDYDEKQESTEKVVVDHVPEEFKTTEDREGMDADAADIATKPSASTDKVELKAKDEAEGMEHDSVLVEAKVDEELEDEVEDGPLESNSDQVQVDSGVVEDAKPEAAADIQSSTEQNSEKEKNKETVDGDDDGELHEELTMAQLAEKAGEEPNAPTTPKSRESNRNNALGSNSTLAGKSIAVPSKLGAASPGMSSVAESVDDNSMRSPPQMPIGARGGRSKTPKEDAEEKLVEPKTARRSNRALGQVEVEASRSEAVTPQSSPGSKKQKAKSPSPKKISTPARDADASDGGGSTPTTENKESPKPAKRTRGRPKKSADDDHSTAATSQATRRSSRRTKAATGTSAETRSTRGRKKNKILDVEKEEAEDSDPDDTLDAAQEKVDDSKPVTRTRRSGATKKQTTGDEESTTDSKKTRRSTRATRATTQEEPASEAEVEHTGEENTVSTRSTRRGTRQTRTTSVSEDKTTATKTRRSVRKTQKEEAVEAEDDASAVGSRRSTRRTAAVRKTKKEGAVEAEDGASGVGSRRSTRRAAPARKTQKEEAVEAEDDASAVGSRRSTRRAAPAQKTKKEEAASDDKDEESAVGSRRSTRRAASTRKTKKEDIASEAEDNNTEGSRVTRASRRTRGAAVASDDGESKATRPATRGRKRASKEENESEGEEEANNTPKSKRAAPKKKRKTAAGVEPALAVIPEINDVEEGPRSPVGKRGAKRKATSRVKKEEESEAAEEEGSSKTRSTRRKTSKPASTSPSPKKGKITRGRGKKSSTATQDDDETVSVAEESVTSSVRRSSRRNKGKRNL